MADVDVLEDDIEDVDDEEIDEAIMHARGRKPKPCWIDGEKVESMAEVKEKLGIHSADMDEFYYCAFNGHLFRGHIVRMTEPRPPRERRKPRVRVIKMERLPGQPLLSGHVTSRLGAWKGQNY